MQFRWRIRLMSRSFVSGIPDHIKQMASAETRVGRCDLAEIVKAAADALYLQDSASRSSSKEMRNMYSRRHRTCGDAGLLSAIYRATTRIWRHTQAAAERAGMVENSIFWRMTYPAALAKDTIQPRPETGPNTEPAADQAPGTGEADQRVSIERSKDSILG